MALLAACAAVYYRLLHTQGPEAQASAGMYAFGDLIIFVAVFGGLALFPTGLALYFLRPFKKFWTVLSTASLALAATAPVAALVMLLALSQQPNDESALFLLAGLGCWRMFAAPLLTPVFILAAFIAPTRLSGWVLVAAAAIEGVIGAYAHFHWFESHRLL
jgi:hypothetical protein